MTSADITSRLSSSGKLLVRSGIEIGRILDTMVEDRATLTANLAETMFFSHLLYVEPVRGYMLLSYSDHKAANTAALAVPKLTLCCNHRGAQFAFAGAAPHAVLRDGRPSIECGMPTILIAQQRRTATRAAVPSHAPISCELRMGTLSFGAQVVDISHDGIGTLVSDPTIPLCAGTRLERARISHPQHEPIEVDLEVSHVTRVRLVNGDRAVRIGCKILSSPAHLEELIRLFIIDLQ